MGTHRIVIIFDAETECRELNKVKYLFQSADILIGKEIGGERFWIFRLKIVILQSDYVRNLFILWLRLSIWPCSNLCL